MEKALKKTVTWRCICLATGAVVACAFTGSLAVGGAISVVSNLVSSVLYFAHEKLWGD